jgi:hypothetical protein
MNASAVTLVTKEATHDTSQETTALGSLQHTDKKLFLNKVA